MTIFLTSDTHFGHDRIRDLAGRPFASVEEMDETMVENWNRVVKSDDVVFHLGDVNLGEFDESIKHLGRLNGRKALIVGNHDRLFRDPDRVRKNEAKVERYIERFRPIYKQYFDVIYDTSRLRRNSLPITVGDEVFVASHFPFVGDSHDKPRYNSLRPSQDGFPLLHGHTHSKEKISYTPSGSVQIHVGVDAWDFTPVSEDQIMDLYHGLV